MPYNPDPFPSIDKLMEELAKLREAYQILYHINCYYGGYGKHTFDDKCCIDDETLKKLNDFFRFDDSE